MLKDFFLIGVGIFIIVHETLGTDLPSPVLLVVAAACLSLSIVDYLMGVRGNGQKPTPKPTQRKPPRK